MPHGAAISTPQHSANKGNPKRRCNDRRGAETLDGLAAFPHRISEIGEWILSSPTAHVGLAKETETNARSDQELSGNLSLVDAFQFLFI